MVIFRTFIRTVASVIIVLAWPNAYGQSPELYGKITTTDGRHLEGSMRLEPNGFQVTDAQGQEQRVPLEELTSFIPSSPPPPPPKAPVSEIMPTNGLLGTYFESQDWQGKTQSRVDATIDFNWAEGSPFPEFPSDHFRVRWEGEIETLVTGSHQFHVLSDDGVRLWVNEQMLIDQWKDQSVMETTGMINLDQGQRYPIKLEYFENTGQAIVRLGWTPPGQTKGIIPESQLFPLHQPTEGEHNLPAPAEGWLGMYFKRQDLRGPYQAVTNATLDFDWGNASPLPRINPDHFSVRWVGELSVPETGLYTFHVENDDGMKLWIDEKTVISSWSDGVLRLQSNPISLEKDHTYLVRYEMYENASQSKARLFWSSDKIQKTIVPSRQVKPVAPLPYEEKEETPLAPPSSQPPGIWLTTGTFLAQPVMAVDSSFVHFSRPPSDPAIPVANVARIQFQEIPAEMLKELESGRPGVLLKTGDFMDGEMRKFEKSKLQLNSVLLGLRTFPANQVLAVTFGGIELVPARWEIQTKNRSTYRVNQIEFTDNRLVFLDPSLRGMKEDATQVTVMRRLD